MSVYFTSDLHIGHQKVAEDRNFNTTDEHDEHILNALVDQTRVGDQVWILGDLTVGGRAAEERALAMLGAALMGRSLHLIPGNHDSCHPMTNRNSHNRIKAFYEVFDSVQLFARRRVAGETVLLSHFPYWGDHTDKDRGVQFRLRDEWEWLLHGHTHSYERGPARDNSIVWDDGGRSYYPNHKQIHVGWDAWGRLVSLDDVEAIITG
ncbi:metallophosphoesterase [Rhodococcus sp. BH5]|uniref:metallophosphoesterase n=1 Tax=Rhodococcus sp. BH5 TaxID=2871702 RepID=UPI0022CD369B|nr:metallophosphoesterase [Rhodococcus sp. BH5]MCZ9634711.1 metallophosphoesterase [Rhodococcus sp. BH5]